MGAVDYCGATCDQGEVTWVQLSRKEDPRIDE